MMAGFRSRLLGSALAALTAIALGACGGAPNAAPPTASNSPVPAVSECRFGSEFTTPVPEYVGLTFEAAEASAHDHGQLLETVCVNGKKADLSLVGYKDPIKVAIDHGKIVAAFRK